MKLRVTRSRHNRREKVTVNGKTVVKTVAYEKDETFEGSERELKQFKDRLEAVSGGSTAKKAAAKKTSDKGDAGGAE